MGAFFGGDSPPTPPQLPPPPKEKEILDVIDEIAGSQTITVTGADGKKRRVTSKLPRTEDEERVFRQAGEMIGVAINNLNTNLRQLYSYDPSRIVAYQGLVDTFANINNERAQDLAQIANIGNIEQDIQGFRQMQQDILSQEFNRINQEQENRLIDSGHYNSSAGQEMRARLMREEAEAQQQAGINAQMYGEQIAQNRLNRNATAYGLREQGRTGQLQQAQSQYALEQQRQADLRQMREDAVRNDLSQVQLGAALRGEDLNRAMASQAPQLGMQQWATENQNAMNNYIAQSNNVNQQYQNQVAAYQARPRSFLETAAGLGSTIGMGMLTAGQGSVLGGWGSRLFGST